MDNGVLVERNADDGSGRTRPQNVGRRFTVLLRRGGACGVALACRSLRSRVGRRVDYIGSVDATIGGSRSGHAPLLLWYAIRRYGREGLRLRAERSRELAEYAVSRLDGIGVPAWRHPYAFTVVFPTPPSVVTGRWSLATSGGLSHIVCMPGIHWEQFDAFVADLATALVPARGRAPS
jgi:histidine decarboxylase